MSATIPLLDEFADDYWYDEHVDPVSRTAPALKEPDADRTESDDHQPGEPVRRDG